MTVSPPHKGTRALHQAEAFLRTAESALQAELFAPALSNARHAAELGAIHLLGTGVEVTTCADKLVTAGFWPPGKEAIDLSRLLTRRNRGVDDVQSPVTRDEAASALSTARNLIQAGRKGSDKASI